MSSRSSRGWVCIHWHRCGYVWTRGGYQVVARDPEDYPLFIAVHEPDLDAWTAFFDRFGIPTAEERLPAADLNSAIQVVLKPRPQIEPERVDGRPVISLQETVAFANEHYALPVGARHARPHVRQRRH